MFKMETSVLKILLVLSSTKWHAESSKFTDFFFCEIMYTKILKLRFVKVKWRFFGFFTVEILEKSFEIVEGKEMMGTFTISPAKTRLDCIMSCINTIGCHAVNVMSNNRNNYITSQLFTKSCKPRHMSKNINSTTYFRCKYYGILCIMQVRSSLSLIFRVKYSIDELWCVVL